MSPIADSSIGRRVSTLARRAVAVFRANWHLGLTAFGGPPVHFKIVG
jgi:hypothetical protein